MWGRSFSVRLPDEVLAIGKGTAMANAILKTGISALDAMLGDKGIPSGSIVLVRGGPGTGKTTLALQIIANHLAQKRQEKKQNEYAAFVSLETDPDRAVQHAKEAFGFRLEGRFVTLGRKRFEKIFPFRKIPKDFADKIRKVLEDEVIGTLVARGFENLEGLIVFDSLNLLATIFAQNGEELRTTLHRICSEMHLLRERATVILLAEYDPQNIRSAAVAAESFFCDVQIQLAMEPVVQARASIPSGVKTGGGLSGAWKQPVPHTLETRHFCSVVKCRTGPSQARRCAYDIVSDRGIVFYETYPADGQIMLFAENIRQREEWEGFFATDILQLYPALQFGLFGRSSLQRTFASLRRFRDIPERTDLYLASFDTYWIRWYVELCQRCDLADRLRDTLPCATQESLRKQFPRIVGRTHRRCAEWLAQGNVEGQAGDLAQEIAEGICADCGKNRKCGVGRLQEAIENAWKRISTPERQGGLLHLLPETALSFFGERRSGIISELEGDGLNAKASPGAAAAKCVFRPALPSDSKEVLAIPYNANIGVFVCRKDTLDEIVTRGKRKGLIDRIVALHGEKTRALKGFIARNKLRIKVAPKIDNPKLSRRAAEERVDELLDTKLPKTWEEVMALCAPRRGKKRHFLIETRTFDTYLCTLLEWLWGTGGDLTVLPDYTIQERNVTAARLFEAFWIFRTMRQKQIIPRNSTLEAVDFAKQYGKRSDDESEGSESPDWLFARHWHSTFVDILTATDQDGDFLWEPLKDGVQLEVTPIPVSLSKYIVTPEAARDKIHSSCWGEWYLALLRGSENQALATDLINNLMSSRRICERAFSCAALPTVELFYETEMYGGIGCFNIPERRDIGLPEMTFAELRKRLFMSAGTRTRIFDYRHCMRYLHAILEHVHDFPALGPEGMGEEILKALEKIEGLGKTEILLGQTEQQ